ncbi:MAG TPA: ArsR family transcriptional regulator [candidate division Zixibacteria bacterium]|nr:ArsR family transcriptional regulator [candidate division Zixibacteria bacterium]
MYEKSAEEIDKITKENGHFDSKYSIEEILSSKGRIIILKTLAEKEELNISAIARVANLNHSTTTQHLKFLTSAGLIQEKTFGRIKIFRFCIENYRAKSLKRLFEIWK